jgi:SAM-dependent methyltransferase
VKSGAVRSFYAEDLAYVHDADFLDFARRAAPGVLGQLRRHCPAGARVIEIGCGSGGLTLCLAEAGYRVLGVDIAPAMLRLARRRAPGAKFRAASWYDFPVPPCEAIVAVGECLNYMTAGRRGHEAALRRLFRRAAAALPSGGLLLFDFLEPLAGRPRHRNVEAYGSDWVVLVAAGEDRWRRVLTRRITTIRRVGWRQRLSQEIHRQCLLRRREVSRALRAAGFTVRFHAGYGRRRLKPGQVVAEAVRTKD